MNNQKLIARSPISKDLEAHYGADVQRLNVHIRDEWPTLLLMGFCYSSYAGLVLYAETLGLAITVPLLAIVLTLHSSLQHESLHGHPTPFQWVNDFLVSLPIGLLVPYLRFKDQHLAHHYDPNLTDPYDDPESAYLDPEKWHYLSSVQKTVLNFNNTLFGRLVIGPFIGLSCFYKNDIIALIRLDPRVWLAYALHAAGLLVVIIGFQAYSTMPFWAYLLAAYAGISILKIRTFLEHRAHETVSARTVIIEDKGLLALLFLNNNFHAVHHAYPRITWHRLPAMFKERRVEFLRRNRGYCYKSYGQIFREHLFVQKEPVAHPLMGAEDPKLQSVHRTERPVLNQKSRQKLS